MLCSAVAADIFSVTIPSFFFEGLAMRWRAYWCRDGNDGFLVV
jgi:hypothetical protein